MHYLPVVDVGMPDTVRLSGSTTLKTLKAICNWTVSGFEICPSDTRNIISHEFYLPDSSKWCVELKKDDNEPKIRFCLMKSNNFQNVRATVEASVFDEEGLKYCVYPPLFQTFIVGTQSKSVCVTDTINMYELPENWNFECEVYTIDIVTKDTSDTVEEGMQSAVAKDLERLLDSKDLTDITLSAGSVRLDAHRAILCARSPVFRAKITPETEEAQESLLEIPDVEPQVVSHLLRYMYTDIVKVPRGLMEQLLVAFDKYGLQDAKLKCEQELAKQITIDSAADIAVCAVVNSCSFLLKACVAFIKQNLEQVVGSRGWENIIDKYPKAVKTISEQITERSDRSSSPTPTSGLPPHKTTVEPQTVASASDYHTTGVRSEISDTVRDSCYNRCLEKKVVYIWTIAGLTNWPEDRKFVSSPRFRHPESIQWELRLYKSGIKYHIRFKLLENPNPSVIVDLSTTVISPEGQKCQAHRQTDRMLDTGTESGDFECGILNDDVLTVECEIDIVCIVHQCAEAIKPVLQYSLRRDLHFILESGSFSDFKLCTGTIEMGAHMAILAARSPFFARMLQHDLELLKKGRLEVPDVKPEVLAEVLHYMYTGSVKNLGDSVVELLAAAHRFELSDLKNECLAHLSNRPLTVANAVTTAVCAMENQCDTLLNLSVGFIRSHFKQVMGTTQWIEAIDTHPAALKKISQLVSAPTK